MPGPVLLAAIIAAAGLTACLGTRALILPGVTLGRGCVVAAGSTVSRDVPPVIGAEVAQLHNNAAPGSGPASVR